MSAAIVIPGNTANAFLTHYFGSGLSDNRYTLEHYRAMVNGDIHRCPDPVPDRGKGRCKAIRSSATLTAVKEMRPESKEIIICTGLGTGAGSSTVQNSMLVY